MSIGWRKTICVRRTAFANNYDEYGMKLTL